MKQLVIISGKGGTGKTSLCASFVSLAGNAVACDCDVDAADLYLLLSPESAPGESFLGAQVAVIDPDRCTSCGKCEQACRYGAISGCRVIPDSCEGCAVCTVVCPADAVRMLDREVGRIFVTTSRFGPFVHGRLHPGAANSGKLVSALRKKAFASATDGKHDLIVIDGSPGIGCPVIASMAGTDLAVIVTEPTVSGLHDLQRVADAAAHFNTSCAVIINKADINPAVAGQIEEYCTGKDIPVAGRIPYDPVLNTAMVQGIPVTEMNGAAVAGTVRGIWQKIRTLLTDTERTQDAYAEGQTGGNGRPG